MAFIYFQYYTLNILLYMLIYSLCIRHKYHLYNDIIILIIKTGEIIHRDKDNIIN